MGQRKYEEHRLGWVRRGGGGFKIGRLIEAGDAETLLASDARLLSYRHRAELVVALGAYHELIAALDRWENETVDIDRAMFEISRQLSVWLEATYMLIDRIATRLARTLPEDSPVHTAWERLRTGMFDEYPSYRLAYHLRQKSHQGLPPLSASYSAKTRTEGTAASPVVRLTRSALLRTFSDWHAMVREDLEDKSGGDVIDLRAFAREHQANLNGLVIGLMIAGLEHFRADRDLLAQTLEELSETRPDAAAFPVVFGLPVRAEEMPVHKMTIGISPLFEELVDWFDQAASGLVEIDGISAEELDLPPEGVIYRP